MATLWRGSAAPNRSWLQCTAVGGADWLRAANKDGTGCDEASAVGLTPAPATVQRWLLRCRTLPTPQHDSRSRRRREVNRGLNAGGASVGAPSGALRKSAIASAGHPSKDHSRTTQRTACRTKAGARVGGERHRQHAGPFRQSIRVAPAPRMRGDLTSQT
jgi:hypothetical protein